MLVGNGEIVGILDHIDWFFLKWIDLRSYVIRLAWLVVDEDWFYTGHSWIFRDAYGSIFGHFISLPLAK
jgi:hypothetical protein